MPAPSGPHPLGDRFPVPAWPGPLSIRARILLLTITVGLVFLALQAFRGVREYERVRDQGVLRVQADATEVAAVVRQLLRLGRETLEGVASVLEVDPTSPAGCSEQARMILAAASFMDNLIISTADGRILCSALPGRPGDDTLLADRPWFERVVTDRTFTLSSLHEGSTTGRPLLVMAVPVPDEAGRTLTVVAGSIDLERFQSIVAGVPTEPGTLITIADQERTVVARSVNVEQWIGTNLPPPEVDVASRTRDGTTYTRASDMDGTRRVWTEAMVAPLGWMVYAAAPEQSVIGPAAAAARVNVAWGLAALALLAFFGAWTYRGVGRPLEALVAGARQAASGRELPIPKNAPSEVRVLAEQFKDTLQSRERARMGERRAKDRYRGMFEQAAIGIYTSLTDGTLLDVNPALVAILGYDDPADLRRVNLRQLYMDPSRRDELIRTYGTDSFQNVDVEWLRKNGDPVSLRLTGCQVPRDGADPMYEVFVQDVTRERALEETSRHQQKMEAIGRLAGGFAHEFNNVLTVIGVNMELIRPAVEESGVAPEVDEVTRAAARGASLTSKFLAMSRKDPHRPIHLDVNEMLDQNEQLLRRVAGEGVALEIIRHRVLPQVRMDRGHLEQVLLNLVINARDAMEGRGTLVVGTRRGARPGTADDPGVVLFVRDTGPGIPEGARDYIFDPFFTTKGPGEGTGLGLSVVHGIVEEAGGRIVVDSVPGRGATFEVWLPKAEPE